MKARLKKFAKNAPKVACRPTTNIKALAKMAGDEPPNNHRWINAALLKKIKKSLPLMKFKNMTIAGNKALAAYDKKNDEWAKAMSNATERYNKERDKQKRTPREAQNWPKKVMTFFLFLACIVEGPRSVLSVALLSFRYRW